MKKILSGALALIIFVGAAQAQSTQDSARHHNRNGHDMMAKQLNLTADQQAQIKTLRESQHKEMKDLKANSALSSDQQKAGMKELREKYQGQMQAIYTPAQKEQIEKMKSEQKARGNHGKQGVKGERQAKNNKGREFQKELNLTQDQKDKMAKLRSDSRPQFEAIRTDETLSKDQKKAKMQELRNAQQEQMKSILTSEQLEKMKSMQKERKPRTTK